MRRINPGDGDIEVWARDRFGRCVDLYVSQRLANGREAFALPVTLEEREPHLYHNDATVTISIDAAQKLMDGLWSCGIRPVTQLAASAP